MINASSPDQLPMQATHNQIAKKQVLQEAESQTSAPSWLFMLKKIWHKFVMFSLLGHGLLGLYESVSFIFVDFPHLNEQLKTHTITQEEVNTVVTIAVTLMVFTAIDLILAHRLNKVNKDIEEFIEISIATFITFTNSVFSQYLLGINFSQYIGELIAQLI